MTQRLIDPDGTTRFRGTIPGMVQATKATFGFADFTDLGGDLGRSPVAYTLQAGEQLLAAALRVTEAFDDSDSPSFYLASAAVGPFGGLVGPFSSTGPAVNVPSDGLVPLFADTMAVNAYSDLFTAAVEAETPPLALYVFGSAMAFDGATGIIEATFYTCTPATA